MIRFRLDPGQIEVVDEAIAEILRRKTPAQRVAMILDAECAMRHVVAGGVRHAHPDWDDQQVRREVARRMSHETR